MKGHDWCARPSGKGLVITSIVPGWGFGWGNVLKNEIAKVMLSDLGHYARQYIHRSNIAKVLMAAWERNGLILHLFGPAVNLHRYSDFHPKITHVEMLAAAERVNAEQWGRFPKALRVYRTRWSDRNTLDPAIHQAIFHFLRGQNLVAADFKLEALAAYDCVLHSLQNLDWSWADGNPKRDRRDLCLALGFGRRSADLAEYVYLLRNQFVAHAGGWRWWDTGDYLESDTADQASRMTSRALRKAADIEPQHRRLDPSPKDWASWFLINFEQIWSAVWFRDPYPRV